jgi:HlyD family secretion protein
MSKVDLQQLAIEREPTEASPISPGRHVVTRYVLPGGLLLGFVVLIAWSARELVFPPQPVTVILVYSSHAEVQQAGTPLFKAAGWIEPRPTPVRVAALAAGVVEHLLVVEDQPVKKGEPIAEMIKDDAKLMLDRANAEKALRQAELEETQAGLAAAMTRFKQPVHLQAVLGGAEALLAKLNTELKNLPFDILQAEADQDAAQKRYNAKSQAIGVVAGVEVDVAKSRLDSANARVAQLRDSQISLAKERSALVARRDALKTQLELLADEIKAKDTALALVKGATARLERASVVVREFELQLSRMTVRSPIDGRVFHLIGHPGSRLGSGMTQMIGHDGSTIVTLYRPKMLQVRVDVRFEDVPQVRLGQPVEISNAAISTPLIGKVLFVSSEADIQKNTLQVKVAIPDPPPVFKPEMLVDVTFLAPEQEQRPVDVQQELRIYVPQQLIQTDDTGKFVWVADQSASVARKTMIQTGSSNAAGMTLVNSGLTISSRIIVSGSQGLKDGARIRVTGEDSTLRSGEAT